MSKDKPDEPKKYPIEHISTTSDDWEGFTHVMGIEEKIQALLDKVAELTDELNELRGTPTPKEKKPWEI